MERLNKNTKYLYSYPSLTLVKNDLYGDKLTREITDYSDNVWVTAGVKNDELEFGTWYGKTKLPLFDKYKDPHFYIQNDFGLINDVEKVSIKFSKNNSLPEKIELYYTNDGYNYNIYEKCCENAIEENNVVTYEFSYENAVKAKGVRVMVFAQLDKELSFCDLAVFGNKNKNDIKLLSENVSYEWQGDNTDVLSQNKNLTDGIIGKYNEEDKFTARLASLEHPVSKSKVSIISSDLGKVCNINEVMINTLSCEKFSEVPKYITVEYSLDNKDFCDFGQAFKQGDFGTEKSFVSRYMVTRNHTVKARYIKIYITGNAAVSQFQVFGCDNEIEEMKYDHFNRKELIAHTNVIENKNVIINGESVDCITNNMFSYGEVDLEEKENVILCDIGEVKKDINSVMLYFIAKNGFAFPESIKTYVSKDNENFEFIDNEYLSNATGIYKVYRMYFDSKDVRYVKFVICGEKPSAILQAAVYEKQPQLPLYRGGFFQMHLTTSNLEAPVNKNSEYMWYLELKGMKDLGMDYVIMQNGADYVTKRVGFNSPRLFQRGYKLGEGYGTKEPYEVILKIAEKLGMKVYLGTMTTYGQYGAIMEHGGIEHAKAVADDALQAILDMHDKFNKYKSFEGYYFTDETCDEWLIAKHGLEIYRTIYKTQTRLIRELDPTKKTMISPAIWRSGTPQQGEENLYELIKPEQEGGRPIIDIVSAQDCLGRETTLYVSNPAYKDFEEHAEAWAKGVRKAGAEFWNDAEVFEITSLPKRYIDTVHSMEIESKYSNGIIVFDIPHYLCEVTRGTVNDWAAFETAYIISQYAKRYSLDYKDKDRIGME